jgi:hypothetical protein
MNKQLLGYGKVKGKEKRYDVHQLQQPFNDIS